MAKRMIIMLAAAAVVLGGVFGFKLYAAKMGARAMAFRPPPASVSAVKAEKLVWQPEIRSVGSLRAFRGVDVTSEIDGLVRTVLFKAGDEVKAGQVLVELNADSDRAELQSLQAEADLAKTTLERDRKQLEIQSVSQATVDADEAALKSKQADAAKQAALVDKKTIRAAFAGKLGISAVNPGQYIKAGDKIVTLQALGSILVDFYVPQQSLARIAIGQAIEVMTDTYPGKTFAGRITAVNPKVDPETRNVQIEATVNNARHELLPGMYATVTVQAGSAKRYLTVPQTAVTYNPYGDTVFLVQQGTGPDGKPALSVKQAFVTLGETRGDQVAVLSGINEGDQVVTSGQMKLKNGSSVVINNTVQPANEAAPKPEDE
jgi:membrane fusion protein (multidrug efflux system)